MRPSQSGYSSLRWHVVVLANAIDERRRRLLERRRARRRLRRASDPLSDMTDSEFIKTYRLGKDAVRSLAHDVTPLLPRERRRDGMTSMLKILVALAFYATGSYQTLVGQSAHHNVSQASVSRAVRQVTGALNNPSIIKKYIRWPMTRVERNHIKTKFYEKFGIPGVLGCIDGTHVAILKPQHNEERFLCRKGYHSLNVMIICDSNLRIMCVDPSWPGSSHDSIIWNSHPLSTHLNDLNNNGENVFLLGDSGYPLRNTMVTPILNTQEGTPQHHFYVKQVTARNTVERCIGVLKARFRCLLVARTLHYEPLIAGKIVNACTVLHNIALESNAPMPPMLTPEEAQAENNMQNMINEVGATVAAMGVAGRGRVNAALQAGRILQQALVDRLWSNRN